jgi:sulfoxide reductase heme-binding subunit YedZ
VIRWLKPAVFLACLGPAAWLVYGAFLGGDLGVNPVETITNYTGIWTLRLVAISLAVTPIRWLTGWNPVIRLRRMLGLFAFFYGTLHFLTYFVLDHSLMFDGLWDDVVKRPYITAGFTAFVLMIPLALTSTQGWIRRLDHGDAARRPAVEGRGEAPHRPTGNSPGARRPASVNAPARPR